uniref:Uncharacterized protein n=1 Tax=Setaria viridis TaxID=4556 RepID=A0A4U6VT45_SETVI|nr:hypothetical protein SEVIR_2G078666v2 [Setaria viridis]
MCSIVFVFFNLLLLITRCHLYHIPKLGITFTAVY